jgi:nucleotide-binding universal stress UspA family protein
MNKAVAPRFPVNTPVEHLLVGARFAECSDYAIERALECGNTLGAQVTVLHVVEDCLPKKIAKHRQQEARELLAARVRLLCPDARRDISINVRIGDPPLEIIREAIELGSDAIVLGTNKWEFFRDDHAASTAAAVAHYSNIPLLLVTRRPAGPYRRCAVDVTGLSQFTLAAASRFAPSAEPYFVLVHSPPTVALGCLKENVAPGRVEDLFRFADGQNTREAGARAMPGAIRLVEAKGDPIEALLDCVDQIGADVLIVGSERALQDAREDHGGILQQLSAPRCDLLLVANQ